MEFYNENIRLKGFEEPKHPIQAQKGVMNNYSMHGREGNGGTQLGEKGI